LDNSATSLKPQSVIDATNYYYSYLSTTSHNEDSIFTSNVNRQVYQTREMLSNFFNAKNGKIIFTSGATESLNMIANGLIEKIKKSDQILITKLEHSSNLLP